MEKKKPPKRVRKAVKKIRREDVQNIVAKEDIFPPNLLLPMQGARKRVNHLTWVLRYRLAHREATGIESFRGSSGKRTISYEWTGWQTDTLPRQIEEEIKTIYRPDESAQKTFQGHLEEFVEIYENYESRC